MKKHSAGMYEVNKDWPVETRHPVHVGPPGLQESPSRHLPLSFLISFDILTIHL